jgi:hypothetical protein
MQCMAKRTRTTPNIEPSEMTITLSTGAPQAPGTTGSHYVDLSLLAGIINRRFYRQGLNWAVAGFKFLVGAGEGSVSVYKLPNTWVMKNAWVKGFENWRERIETAIGDDDTDVKGKFLDFKVYADDTHRQQALYSLLPLSQTGAAAIPGEWLMSRVNLKVGNGGSVQHEITAVGDNYPGIVNGYNAVSLIQGYASSRALPNRVDPNTPDDLDSVAGTAAENWMTALHNEDGSTADQFIIQNVTGADLPPYPFENDGTSVDTMYPGGANQLTGLAIHDFASYSSTSIGGTTYAKGGNFPCGLIRLDHAVDAESISHNLIIQVDLVPGSHRGYMAEPMGDM